MFIKSTWLVDPPLGLGRQPAMSKAITPHTVGETRDCPNRTMLCLKAWMLWRAYHCAGWVGQSQARQRLFMLEAQELWNALRRLQPQPDGMLGDAQATSYLQQFVPGLVTKLLSGPASGGSSASGSGAAIACEPATGGSSASGSGTAIACEPATGGSSTP